jgi:pimeloyl-ACP methyl ester carboxylesterase
MGCRRHRHSGASGARSRRAAVLALLLVAAAGCAVTGGSGERPLFSAASHGVDRFVRVSDRTIHYVEAGAGPPILLIPGAFTTYRAWERMMAGLSPHARVLAVDYVGIGDSDKPEAGFGYTVEEQADVMAEMLLALGLSDVTVVGASYGAAVALNLAVRHPAAVGRVVCIEGGALIAPEVLDYGTLGDLLTWPVLGDIVWGFMQSGLFDGIAARSLMGPAWERLTRERQREIVAVVSANVKTSTRASWVGIYRAITRRIDFMEALAASRTPVLYLYGSASKYRAVADANAERLATHGPHVEVVPFPGGIHDLHLQYPEAVTGIVLQFAAGALGASVVSAGTDPGRGDRIGSVVD